MDMHRLLFVPLLFTILFCSAKLVSAQTTPPSMPPGVSVGRSGIVTRMKIDETTPIFDKVTGKRVSFQEYQQLINRDRYSIHLEPVFDEYGEPTSYKLRPTTTEERETHFFKEMDGGQRPKPGEIMPLFVMKGIDDKVYRSTDLKGHVVILSFWISVRKPFWGAKQTQQYSDIVRPFRSETDPISLGILQSDKEEVTEVMAAQTFPFIPIPNSYNFHRKFHVTSGPSFIVIDRNGVVADFIDGGDYERLKQALAKVNR